MEENKILYLGTMTLPYGVFSSQVMTWLEEWLLSSSEGILGFDKRHFKVILMNKESLDNTINTLLKHTTGWVSVDREEDKWNKMFAPNGTSVLFEIDENNERNIFLKNN